MQPEADRSVHPAIAVTIICFTWTPMRMQFYRFALVVESIVSERQGRQALEVKGREMGTIVQIWKL